MLENLTSESHAARAVSPNAEGTVVISRVFDAPRELVFDAWTRPEHLLRWFAPRGCSFQIERIDVRPGGGFHSCIRDASFECWCLAEYLEIKRRDVVRVAQSRE